MNDANKTMRIDEELVCMDAIVFCLKNNYSFHQLEVQREVNDPPDFWITINGEKFAAEVTSIVKDYDYHVRCRGFKDDMKKIAAKQGVLAGTYALEIRNRPEIPNRRSPEYQDIKNHIISFIQNTRNVISTDEVVLLKNRRNILSIRKLDDNNATIGLIGPLEVKRKLEIQQDLSELMQKAIDRKRQRLEAVREKGIQVILLLYDAYAFGDTDDALAALLRIKGYDWFHSIFWASSFTDRENQIYPQSPGRDGKFLFTRFTA